MEKGDRLTEAGGARHTNPCVARQLARDSERAFVFRPKVGVVTTDDVTRRRVTLHKAWHA